MSPTGIDQHNKASRLYQALEISGPGDLHGNTAEILQRYLLTLDVERLGPLILAIEGAKDRHHARKLAELQG